MSALCCVSCSSSGKLNPVQGKVLYKNQPMTGALVTFHPKGANNVTALRPVGLVKENGAFALTTGTKVGAAAGEYVVTVIWPEELTRKKGLCPEPPSSRDRLRGAYAQQATSPFKIQITSGRNQVEPFHLK